MSKVAVIGAKGYVGSEICRAIRRHSEITLNEIVRGDDLQSKADSATHIIHAANPARRFAAQQNPEVDFVETVEKTYQIIQMCPDKEGTLISSLSCRTQLDHSYGRNRRACELLATSHGWNVIRLGPMFGGSRKKDVLHDILLGNRIYLAKETRYAYVDVEWAAEWVADNFAKKLGVQEIGARDSVALGEIAEAFGSSSEFDGPDDTQEPQGFADGPTIEAAFDFARLELHNAGQD